MVTSAPDSDKFRVYLSYAATIQRTDPVIALYCKQYALQLVIQEKQAKNEKILSEEAKKSMESLCKNIEDVNAALNLSKEAKEKIVEQYCVKMNEVVQKDANNPSISKKDYIDKLRMTADFIELLSIFGPLSPHWQKVKEDCLNRADANERMSQAPLLPLKPESGFQTNAESVYAGAGSKKTPASGNTPMMNLDFDDESAPPRSKIIFEEIDEVEIGEFPKAKTEKDPGPPAKSSLYSDVACESVYFGGESKVVDPWQDGEPAAPVIPPSNIANKPLESKINPSPSVIKKPPTLDKPELPTSIYKPLPPTSTYKPPPPTSTYKPQPPPSTYKPQPPPPSDKPAPPPAKMPPPPEKHQPPPSKDQPPPSKPQHPPAKKANPPSSDPPKSPQIPPSTIPRYTKLPGHVTKSSPEYEKIMAEALKKAEYAQNEIFFKNKAPARQFILEAIAAIKKLAE